MSATMIAEGKEAKYEKAKKNTKQRWQAHRDSVIGKDLAIQAIITAITDGNPLVIFHFYYGIEKFTVSRGRVHEAPLGSSENANGIKAALAHISRHIDKPKNPIKNMLQDRNYPAMVTWKLEIHPDMEDKITALKKLFGQH